MKKIIDRHISISVIRWALIGLVVIMFMFMMALRFVPVRSLRMVGAEQETFSVVVYSGGTPIERYTAPEVFVYPSGEVILVDMKTGKDVRIMGTVIITEM